MTLRKGLRLDPVHAGGIVFLLLLYLVFLSLVPAKALGAQLPAATPAWQPAPNLTLRGREDNRPISALLVGTKIDVDVAGPVARGTVTQIFTNPTRDWAEGTYVFPLPEESAVDHFTLRVGDRVIDGVVHEREEAHRMYAEAAKAGRRAGLLDQERPNIFTVSVANIPPADMVAVAFSFRIPVRYTRDHYELRMPLVVGPRYIPPRTSEVLIITAPGLPMLSPTPDSPGPDSPGPGSPDVAPRPDAPATPGGLDQDALRISPPYRHPSEGSTNPVALTVALSPGFDLAKLESPSHPVTVEKNGDTYRIALAEDVPADRDFVLTWIPEQGAVPSAAALSDAGADGTYVLATVLPPDAGADAPAPPPREVVFVIDISGSMGGTSIGQAKAALLYALDRLRPGDRFNVIAFNDKSMPLFTEPRAMDEPALAAARGFVTDLEANGGTEMAEPLASALTGDPPAGYLRQIVFLTDGSVGNEAQLFGLIVRNLKTARLFMVGIGSAPNGFFMTKAAETGRGASIMISDVGQVKERMAGLIRKLESPAMTDLAVTWGEGVKGEMYPSRLPDLYTGEPLTFVVRLDGPGSTLHIAGKRGGVAWSADVAPKPAAPESGIDKLWAAKKIDGLMSTAYEGADRTAIRDAVVTLGLKHQLLTRYTSLVAVERGSSRPEDAPVAKGAIPLNMPAGWDYEKVFGPATGIAPASFRRAAAPAPPASASAPAAPPLPAAPLPAAQDVKVGVALGQGGTPAGVNTLAALGLLSLAWLVFVVRRKTA